MSDGAGLPCLDCEQIWFDYKDRVERYVFSHVSQTEDAQDLVSSVFTRIVQSAPSYRGDPNHVSSFVYRTTHNIVIDYYRGKKAYAQMTESAKAVDSVENDYFTQSSLDFLADSLALLPIFERDIIVLHYYKGISLKKVADRMQKSYEKVKMAHRRGLDFLKDRFREFEM